MGTAIKNDIDLDWEKFLNNDFDYHGSDMDDKVLNNNNVVGSTSDIPKCSNIYISTKTKISYLNKNDIDIKNVFWKIPVIPYATPQEGVIKKQMKFSSTAADQLDVIQSYIKNEKYVEEQVIEHIDNPDGRIKFKDQRKISIGLCKKNILSYRCKEKRAFFNCFVLILRVKNDEIFKEMHVKVFNTGKLEIPGVQSDKFLEKVIGILLAILRPYVGNDLNYDKDEDQTVLINSNFNCGYFIDRDKLYDILKYKYNINSNFDSCSYPGIQCKYYHVDGLDIQTGQQPKHMKKSTAVSFMIFRTGSVLIVGKCDEDVLYEIYEFLKKLLLNEYEKIGNGLSISGANSKNKKKKVRKKTIIISH